MLKEFDYENMPIVDIVNEMIIDAISRNASDIHFDPTPDGLKVRIRIDGELLEYAKVPDSIKKNLLTRVKIISNMDIMESRLPQDGAIKRDLNGEVWDLRVSSLPVSDGEKIVIRILDYSMSLEGLDALGFDDINLEKVKRMISTPNGIIMVTGATGTGKSTTVYAMLQRLNNVSRNIVTVEEPVEMRIEGINQVQVMSEIGLTFTSALRSILRQDPDVIMIGEIRDDETARIAVRASITGHLVLSTIHTNNSLNTIERLLDMDVERYLLGTALTGIISQRLTKKLCVHCRSERDTTPYEKAVFKKVLDKDVNKIYSPVGCPECIKGYRGRVAVQEVLMINQSIRDAIISNIRKDKLRKLVYDKENVITLLEDGLSKVLDGTTSFEEILRIIDVEEDFGDDEKDIKEALIGRTIEVESSKQNIAEELPNKEVSITPPDSALNINNPVSNENNETTIETTKVFEANEKDYDILKY